MVYESWFMNKDEEWDCSSHLMIIGGEDRLVTILPWGSPAQEAAFRKQFPDAELTDIEVSKHRGKMEKCPTLELAYPEHWKLIGETWAEWE